MKALILMSLLVFAMPTLANDYLITLQSQHSVAETAEKFAQLAEEKGLRIFARIDHAKNAAGVDLTLKPSQVILFGNPNAGTVLMQCAATVAIDLPQKVLVWEDHEGKVWLAYPNPAFLKELHTIEGCDSVLEKITGLLAMLAGAATT